jgi:hypothetical protein
MAYNQPITSTYTLRAATISSAATMLTVIGPRGYKGRLMGIGAVVTTSTTDAATLLTVGTAADGDKFGTLSVPVATAGAAAAYNNPTITAVDSNIMAENTAVVIATNGGCTAGAADVTVTIDWFK